MTLVTEEVVRKPNAPVNIKCKQCGREALLEQMLKEELIVGYDGGAVDVLLVCPHCGYRHHSYYATEHLLFKQKELRDIQMRWQAKRLPEDFTAYRHALEVYNVHFDRTQKRLAAFVKKESQVGRAKK